MWEMPQFRIPHPAIRKIDGQKDFRERLIVRKTFVKDRQCIKAIGEKGRRISAKATFYLLKSHTLHPTFRKINGHEVSHKRSVCVQEVEGPFRCNGRMKSKRAPVLVS